MGPTVPGKFEARDAHSARSAAMHDLGAPEKLPKGTPRRLQTVYVYAFFTVALLSLIAVGLSRIPAIAGGLADSCRALHLCSPPPLKPLPPLATGWMPSGSTWASASGPLLERYRQENPDYDIQFHEGNEYHQSGPFNANVQYRYEGTFAGTPHWRGVFEIVSSWFTGQSVHQ
jgi:hypothetical protein